MCSQLSPFKVGAIQQLIADGNADLGKKTAPYFATILVLFLLAFLGYFVTALVALVVCRLTSAIYRYKYIYISIYIYIYIYIYP